MKAVLIFLAAMIILMISAINAPAAEPELSLDYFWGEGDLKSDPEEQNESKPKGFLSKVAIPDDSDDDEEGEEHDDTDGREDDDTKTTTPTKKRSDINGLILGLRYPIGRFRPGFEIGFGDEEGDGWKGDFKFTDLKAGYGLFEGEKGWLEPYLSYLNLEAGGYNIENAVVGVDFRYHLASRWSLDGGVGVSFDSKLKKNGDSFNNEAFNLVRIKFLYHLNNRWDLGLGYRCFRFDGEASKDDQSDIKAKYAFTTLGFIVKLGTKPKEELPLVIEPQLEPEPIPESEVPEQEPKFEPEPEIAPIPLVPVLEISRLLKPIFFDFDKSNIRDDQVTNLNENIAILKDHPDLYILVGGHADYHGSIDYNVALSKRRAQSVADYLVQNGIESERITIYAYGESYPYDKYEVNPDWESDRWVDILVFDLPPTWEMGIENRGVMIELK
jgi:outer membrane protein OmpA-like peptidoglycan-associated protein